jgi:uncharacterized protein YciI
MLLYELADDYVERRAQFREQHLALATEARARGELVMAGALVDPVDGAALVFRAPDEAVAARFAEADPYVVNGLVTQWSVRRWRVVVGPDAEPL